MDDTSILKYQYELVKEARAVLFYYCGNISPVDFVQENTGFGRGGSVRNLLVHIANTYEFWIGKIGLSRNMKFTGYESIATIEETINLYQQVDNMLMQFLAMDRLITAMVDFEINNTISQTSMLKLYSHVITHEFHHKGQVLSISRQLGYLPVDTDIMR